MIELRGYHWSVGLVLSVLIYGISVTIWMSINSEQTAISGSESRQISVKLITAEPNRLRDEMTDMVGVKPFLDAWNSTRNEQIPSRPDVSEQATGAEERPEPPESPQPLRNALNESAQIRSLEHLSSPESSASKTYMAPQRPVEDPVSPRSSDSGLVLEIKSEQSLRDESEGAQDADSSIPSNSVSSSGLNNPEKEEVGKENIGTPKGQAAEANSAADVPKSTQRFEGAEETATTDKNMVHYIQLVQKKLNQQKRYPKRARRKRYQGRVVFHLTLNHEGAVLSSGLAESSGHELLDREALKMIRRAQPFPAFHETMSKSELEMLVPISFVLQ